MQCILTRVDFDLYYGGEAFSVEQPQSFTCPYCGKMGYTETSLQEHVTSEHAETSTEVICPICAALPGGDPNHVTDDFAAHLTLEHRAPRDLDESSGVRHVRRMFHPGRGLEALVLVDQTCTLLAVLLVDSLLLRVHTLQAVGKPWIL